MTFRAGDNPKILPKNAKAIDRLTESGRYRDHEVKGLYLQVTNQQNRSWLLRYQIAGRPRALGLGPYPLVTLTKARELARNARLDLLGGVDPVAAKAERKAGLLAKRAKALTFAEATQRYYDAKATGWKTERQRAAFLATMNTHAFPVIGRMQVKDVDTDAVLRMLKPIWTTTPSIASVVRGRIEKVLDWSTVSGLRSGDNPARWRSHLSELLAPHAKIAPVEHHAAMPYRELPAFMSELRAQDGTSTRALEFCILTASRTSETLGATWDEIDLDEAVWTVPKERMKAGRAHRVPLSPAAMAILDAAYREDGNPYVFIGSKAGAGLSDRALSKVLSRLGRSETAHGFRSAFRDWAGNETHYPREVAEAALAHVVGDKAEQAYRRSDALEKRRKLMEAWAAYCNSPPAEPGKILPLRRAK